MTTRRDPVSLDRSAASADGASQDSLGALLRRLACGVVEAQEMIDAANEAARPSPPPHPELAPPSPPAIAAGGADARGGPRPEPPSPSVADEPEALLARLVPPAPQPRIASARIECEVLLAARRRRTIGIGSAAPASIDASLPGPFAHEYAGLSTGSRSARRHRIALVIVSTAATASATE
ncbi:MAG TPA: hypothetical protein PKC43_04635 [Phycisphaerales bacterium]|nr:hypothetical protein [Phycisphaerales bacterium]HMP36714.1 hypothetical protein [Phycisphaerales bacterium]